MNFSSYHTAIKIDDPKTGEPRAVALRIKRMTVNESTQFSRDYYRSANPASNTMIVRKPDGEEQEKRSIGEGDKARDVFVITDDEIKNRRLSAMSDDERALYHKLDDEEETFSSKFIEDTLTRFVRVKAGQDLTATDDFENDGAEAKAVRTGMELANLFGGREAILRDLLRAVHVENTQDEATKKVLRPLFGFVRFSDAHETDLHGLKPAQTADDAANVVSAPVGDAGRAEVLIPSGLEVPNSSGIAVPSLISGNGTTS